VTTSSRTTTSQNAVCMLCGAHDTRGFRDVLLHTDVAKELWNATASDRRYYGIGQALGDGRLKPFEDVTIHCSSVEACHRRRVKKITGKR
jgi:hypothetical protein